MSSKYKVKFSSKTLKSIRCKGCLSFKNISNMESKYYCSRCYEVKFNRKRCTGSCGLLKKPSDFWKNKGRCKECIKNHNLLGKKRREK